MIIFVSKARRYKIMAKERYSKLPKQLSKDFTDEDFTCGCGCGRCDVDEKLVNALQELRDILKLPIKVISGCRCKKYDEKYKEPKDTQHINGKAADIAVHGLSMDVLAGVAESVDSIKSGGIGVSKKWVHIDVKKGKRRWRF